MAHRLDKSSQARIIAHLKRMEHRTYLWLQLTFKEIEKSAVAGTTEKQLRKFISTLPKSVDEAYENILNKSKEPDVARKILQCVLVARETLTATELNVAFGVWHFGTSYSTLDLEPDDSFSSTLKQICGNFVIVHNDRVYLIHQTARDFLMRPDNVQLASTSGKAWQHSIIIEEAEATLAHTCMSVLCFEDFLKKPPYSAAHEDYQEWFDRVDSRPFFTYCSRFWTSHYHGSADMARLGMHEKIRRLCNPGSTYFLNWGPACRAYLFHMMFSSLFQVISFFGIDSLVIESLNEISDNGARQSVCDDALTFAARGGRRDTMAVLLERGANVDVRDAWGGYPALYHAVFRENAEAVELLLEHGANVNALGPGHQSALCTACRVRNFGIVELLLAYNADVNAVSLKWGSPLFIAAYWGQKDIVRLLFENGARLRKDDWADSKGWSPGVTIVPTDKLNSIYELVKDEPEEEYIRILIEELSTSTP